MKKLSRILAMTALSIATAALTAAAFAASPAQDMPKIIRHDIPNYALTDSSSYVVSKSLIVNGQKLDMQPLQLNGCLLVPARAVSNALGFTTTWDAAEQAVTITGPYMKTTQYLGVDFSSAVTTIPGAVGMTAPTSFGAAPILVHNTAYVPVEIFKIIQGNEPDALTISDTAIELKTITNK